MERGIRSTIHEHYDASEAGIDSRLADELASRVGGLLRDGKPFPQAVSEVLKAEIRDGELWSAYRSAIGNRLKMGRKKKVSGDGGGTSTTKSDWRLQRNIREAELLSIERGDREAGAEVKYEDKE